MSMLVKRILCFAPHPDDEVLGCGGSLVKARRLGCQVSLCYLSHGEYGSPRFSPKKLAKIRQHEALAVANSWGIDKENITFLGIPDNQINCHDLKSMKAIIKLTRDIKPDLVYLPHEQEKSFDHAEANRLIMRALDMAGSNNFFEFGECAWWVENVLAYEVLTPLEKYQYTEDISDFINQKIQALQLYQSQTVAAGNISDFVSQKAKFLSGWRAATTLGNHREVFQVLRMKSILDKTNN